MSAKAKRSLIGFDKNFLELKLATFKKSCEVNYAAYEKSFQELGVSGIAKLAFVFDKKKSKSKLACKLTLFINPFDLWCVVIDVYALDIYMLLRSMAVTYVFTCFCFTLVYAITKQTPVLIFHTTQNTCKKLVLCFFFFFG